LGRRNCNSQPNTQIIIVGVDSLHSRHFIVSWYLLSDLSLIVLHYYNHSTTETAVVVLNIVWWDLKVIKQCIVLCASLTSGNFSSSRVILCYSIIIFFFNCDPIYSWIPLVSMYSLRTNVFWNLFYSYFSRLYKINYNKYWGHSSRENMVVEFTTAYAISSYHHMARCTRCNIIWSSLSVTCTMSVDFSRYSGFLHQ
jgi:hypothetical protein